MLNELSSLMKSSKSKLPLHQLASLAVALSKLGDSVEVVLPAVITQPVGCELQLSKPQEHTLALILYFSIAVSSIITIPFLRKFPRRPIILFSLYMSIIASVLCAVMPDYTSLIVSRMILGITIPINAVPSSVYLSEISPSKGFYTTATLLSSIGWASGGGWCGILGYLFLERITWRWFVLITSLPLFIPPVILFQFILPETKGLAEANQTEIDETYGCIDSNNMKADETSEENSTPSKAAMISRMAKISALSILCIFPYFGGILLLAVILKEDNIRNNSNSPCQAIHGVQFLAVSLLFGVCHVVGKLLGYAINKLGIPQTMLLNTFSAANLVALALIQFYRTRMAISLTCLCVVQIALSGISTEIDILAYDKFFFTPAYLPVSAGIRLTVLYVGNLIANVLSEFLSSTVVLQIHLGTSLALLLMSLLFPISKERN